MSNYSSLSNYLLYTIFICYCCLTAVHDDQTHEGTSRGKKRRLENGENYWDPSADVTPKHPCVLSEEDELLISQLIEAKPDLIPTIEGTYDSFSYRDFITSFICFCTAITI